MCVRACVCVCAWVCVIWNARVYSGVVQKYKIINYSGKTQEYIIHNYILLKNHTSLYPKRPPNTKNPEFRKLALPDFGLRISGPNIVIILGSITL